MKELISVIVPVYNMERYLERCVKSILQQTYEQLEIILVDDGSTDSSPQMCDAYAAQDDRIKVVHKKNGGLSDARNAGLAVATGTYIGYVDSDDWIEPQMYEKLYHACVTHEAQIAICRYAKVYQDGTIKGGTKEIVPLDREELLQIYICDNSEYTIYNSVWSKLFHRELVEGVLFPVGRNSEDIMYTTKAFCKASKAVYVDECLYDYVLDRTDSIMNVKSEERMFQDEIPFWKEHIAYIRVHVSEEMGDLAAYHFYRRMLSYYIKYATPGSSHEASKNVAKRLISVIKGDTEQIKTLYQTARIARGDKVRMKVFLWSPALYSLINQGYEHWMIPIKRVIRRKHVI